MLARIHRNFHFLDTRAPIDRYTRIFMYTHRYVYISRPPQSIERLSLNFQKTNTFQCPHPSVCKKQFPSNTTSLKPEQKTFPSKKPFYRLQSTYKYAPDCRNLLVLSQTETGGTIAHRRGPQLATSRSNLQLCSALESF